MRIAALQYDIAWGGVSDSGFISMYGIAGVFPTSQDGSVERDQYLLGLDIDVIQFVHKSPCRVVAGGIKKPRRRCLTGFVAEGSVNYLRAWKVDSITKKVIARKQERDLPPVLGSIVRFYEYRLHAVTVSTFRVHRNARSYQLRRRKQAARLHTRY